MIYGYGFFKNSQQIRDFAKFNNIRFENIVNRADGYEYSELLESVLKAGDKVVADRFSSLGNTLYEKALNVWNTYRKSVRFVILDYPNVDIARIHEMSQVAKAAA